MRLLLVRHAESEWNASGRLQGQADPPLSKRGRNQAARVAARLADERVDVVVTSDLERATETAKLIAAAQSLDFEPRPGLREVDLGSWTGASRADLIAEHSVAWSDWRKRGIEGWEGGERYSEAMLRIQRDLEQLAEVHGRRTIVAVTHGGSIRLATCHLLGMDVASLGRIASIGNASITEFRVGRDGMGRIERLNDTAHLLTPTAADDLDTTNEQDPAEQLS